jgi:hypothetical protein
MKLRELVILNGWRESGYVMLNEVKHLCHHERDSLLRSECHMFIPLSSPSNPQP